jgi:2-oxoisovalerate dehydrogenase E1 component beta subunit
VWRGVDGHAAGREFQFIDFISAGFDLLTNYAAKCRYRWGADLPTCFVVHADRACAQAVSLAQRGVVFPEHRGTEDRRAIDAYDAKGLIKAAIRDPDPVLYFEHKKLYRLPRLREELPRTITSSRSESTRRARRTRLCRSSRSARWS